MADTPGGWLHTKEHYDLVEQFERDFQRSHSHRLDKEPKEGWPRGHVYQHGELNELFLAYRRGYAFAKALHAAQASSSVPGERNRE